MLLSQQGQTPYDLKFRLFGVHVRVHPFFWLVAAVLGWNITSRMGIEYILLWVACVFISILLHEFGHVWMGQAFGVRSHIVLQGMCGLAIPDHSPYDRWKRIAISLAGPGIQLLLYLVLSLPIWIMGEEQTLFSMSEFPRAAVMFLRWMNLYWPLMNLVPVWPLDGGQVSRELFTWGSPYNGRRNSLVLSIIVAAVLAINSAMGELDHPPLEWLPRGGFFFAFFFGILAYESYLLLQQENAGRGGWNNQNRWP